MYLDSFGTAIMAVCIFIAVIAFGLGVLVGWLFL